MAACGVRLKVIRRGRAQVRPGRKRMPGFDVGLRTSHRLRRGDQVPATDRSQTVSLLSPRRALDISPRIQHLRIRPMGYDYSVVYVAGSSMGTADILSQLPLANEPPLIDSSDVVERYVSFNVNSLPVTDVLVAKVRAACAADDVIQQILTLCRDEWLRATVPTASFNLQ
jgi:hypothetical protein